MGMYTDIWHVPLFVQNILYNDTSFTSRLPILKSIKSHSLLLQ